MAKGGDIGQRQRHPATSGWPALPRHPSGRALLSGPKAAISKRVGLWSGGWWHELLRAFGPSAPPPIMFFIRLAMSGSAPPASAAPVSSPIGLTPTRRGRSCASPNATKQHRSNLIMGRVFCLSSHGVCEGRKKQPPRRLVLLRTLRSCWPRFTQFVEEHAPCMRRPQRAGRPSAADSCEAAPRSGASAPSLVLSLRMAPTSVRGLDNTPPFIFISEAVLKFE